MTFFFFIFQKQLDINNDGIFDGKDVEESFKRVSISVPLIYLFLFTKKNWNLYYYKKINFILFQLPKQNISERRRKYWNIICHPEAALLQVYYLDCVVSVASEIVRSLSFYIKYSSFFCILLCNDCTQLKKKMFRGNLYVCR
jgi:hypothetical protein